MFSESINESNDKQSENSATSGSGPSRRSKKSAKRRSKNKNNLLKKNHRFAVTMTSWAENFTVAATWQLKHQVAYWKSKAKSLEYENKILHDIIRKNCFGSTSRSCVAEASAEYPNEVNFQQDSEDSDSQHDSASEPEKMEEENEFEVSEEFIEFLRANAKYKEEARLERDKLKAKLEKKETESLEAGPSEPVDTTAELLQLYGADYKRIRALEIALESKYLEECDKNKPKYWPNIPFNFS